MSVRNWVGWLTRAPVFETPSVTARARLLLNVLQVLLGGMLAAVVLAVLDPRNELLTTLGLYGPVALLLGVALVLLRRRQLAAAGWLLSTLLFVLVTVVIVLFGGITGNNAVAYVIAVLVAGTCLSRRAAVVVALLSVGAAGAVAYLEHSKRLPDPVAPMTIFNAWISVTVTLLVAAVLHNMAVRTRDASLKESSEALVRLRAAQAENETRALHGKALANLSTDALSISDARSFCTRATSVAASLLSADAVVYLELDDEDRIGVASAYGCERLPTEKVAARDTPLLSVPPRLLTLEEPAVRQTISELGELPTASGLLIPIRGAYRTFGLLGALSTTKRRYSRDEEQFLTTLAGITASLFERERMLERAERAQKMEVVGRLAGGVAHDFNNLLTVMSGVSELLGESVDSGSDHAALLADLDDAITRATLLGRQLLAFSRHQVVAPTTLDLCRLVSEFLPMAKRLVGDDITLEPTLPQGPAYAHVDRGSIEQILLNLIVNARDAMPKGGTINVTVEETTGGLALVVSDSGIGMDDATQQRLFQPFFTTKEQGTGLGLATIADIIARIGGKVHVTSELGRGATFRVSLPHPTLPRSESPGAEPPAPLGGRRARILLAEDHDLVRANIVRMLNSSNYDVVAVSEGIEALRVLESGDRFDLLVTDVTMPGLGGRQLAEVILDTEHETRILFISGHFDAATQGLPEQARFLAKPFTREALLAAIAGALEAP